jgi:hypothetical protein
MQMTEAEKEMLAQVSAAKFSQRAMMAALLFALGEAKTVDPARVLAFVAVIEASIRQPYGVTDPIALRTMALAAEDLALLPAAMDNMATMPPGAGRA